MSPMEGNPPDCWDEVFKIGVVPASRCRSMYINVEWRTFVLLLVIYAMMDIYVAQVKLLVLGIRSLVAGERDSASRLASLFAWTAGSAFATYYSFTVVFKYINDRYYYLLFVQAFFSTLQLAGTLFMIQRFRAVALAGATSSAESVEGGMRPPRLITAGTKLPTADDDATDAATSLQGAISPRVAEGRRHLPVPLTNWLRSLDHVSGVHIILGIACFKLSFNTFVEVSCGQGTNLARNGMFILSDATLLGVLARMEWVDPGGVLSPSRRGQSGQLLIRCVMVLWCAFLLGMVANGQRVC